ncbi:tRNA (adenosine(37)-N6)-dimethylallyltransferase MiaA [Patescibacteria group bacterium]|nr:tRNA (adenosine(37)-N6)-dimethylallyltransferase MiaA [Patescibacteria group bacterium]
MPKSKTKNSRPAKLVVILGPTASGKSDLAVVLARKFHGEVVSADSRQVYRGMNLGTGKITKKEMRGVKHHMLDVAGPKQGAFNVSKFKPAAEKAINKIAAGGKLPILAGGTGFWIDAVALNHNFPDVPPNKKLRQQLDKKSAAQLFTMLQKLLPKRAAQIDRHNKRRLIRAIEIAKAGKNTEPQNAQPKYQALFIGLDMPDAVLREKIQKRLDARLKAGMLAEVKRLHKNGVSWKKLESFGLEYKFCALHLQNKITYQQMRELLFYAIWHYAKRQRTWFKRNKQIAWFDPRKKTTAVKAAALIKKFLEN